MSDTINRFQSFLCGWHETGGSFDDLFKTAMVMMAEAIAQEREECAETAEALIDPEHPTDMFAIQAKAIAALIRARATEAK